MKLKAKDLMATVVAFGAIGVVAQRPTLGVLKPALVTESNPLSGVLIDAKAEDPAMDSSFNQSLVDSLRSQLQDLGKQNDSCTQDLTLLANTTRPGIDLQFSNDVNILKQQISYKEKSLADCRAELSTIQSSNGLIQALAKMAQLKSEVDEMTRKLNLCRADVARRTHTRLVQEAIYDFSSGIDNRTPLAMVQARIVLGEEIRSSQRKEITKCTMQVATANRNYAGGGDGGGDGSAGEGSGAGGAM